MNILVTGASRGIGAAAYALLKSAGHNVAGHSTRGSDELIAGDLTDPAAPRRIREAALDRLGGRIDVLVNNAGIYEGVADTADDEEWHAAWQRTLTVNLQAPAERRSSPTFRSVGSRRPMRSRKSSAGSQPTPRRPRPAA